MPGKHKARVKNTNKKVSNHSQQTRGKKGGVAMQQQPTNQGVSPLLGAAVGAAVGGVVGAAAAVALSDEETREKVKEAAINLKDQAANKLEKITTKAKDTADSAKDVMKEHLPTEEKKRE